MNPTARKIGTVGDCESHRSIRLDNVDATCGDDAEVGISHHREAAQNGDRKHQREHSGIDCKEARTGQSFHRNLLSRNLLFTPKRGNWLYALSTDRDNYDNFRHRLLGENGIVPGWTN